MARVPASEATRKRLKDMFEGNESVERSTLVREAVRLIIEEALEAEVAEELGRGYYDRGEPPGGRGHRNGYRLGKLDTAEGRIEYAVPQVRGIEGWRSEVRAALGGKTEELERLAIEMYARGLSQISPTARRCVVTWTLRHPPKPDGGFEFAIDLNRPR